MKQLLFMALVTAIGVSGTVLTGPFVGVLVYYFYAVLRPQFVWEWSLRTYDLHTFPWSFYVAITTMMVTAATALGILSYPSSGPVPGCPKPRLTATHFLLWGFAIMVTLSTIFARHPEVAIVYYMELIKLFIMFTVAAFAVQRINQLWWLLIAVSIADIYVSYEVNFHYFATGYLFLAKQGFGGLDNNGAALMFAMIIPSCYFLWEANTNRFRWVFLVGIAFLGHAVLLSFSRGAMLSLIVTAPLLLLYSQKRKYIMVFLVIAGMGVLATAGPEVQERFFSISQHEADESAQSRMTTWKIAIKMAMEEPVFGLGVRNSNLYTKAYGADMDGRSIHSQYLQIAADCGIIASALFVLMLGSALRSAWRARRAVHGRTDTEAVRVRAMAAGVSCGLAVYTVGASFLSLDTFEMPYILVLIAAQLQGLRVGEIHPNSDHVVVKNAVPRDVPLWPKPGTPMSSPIGKTRLPPQHRFHNVHDGLRSSR